MKENPTASFISALALRWLPVAVLPVMVCAQPISPFVVGNNLWYADSNAPSSSPSTSVMNLSGQAGVRLIRIGGAGFDGGMPSDTTLLTWVSRIRATGAEPLIQVSQYRTAAQAAATVQFLNVTSGANVTYWSIGNEPWLQANQNETPDPTEAQIATRIATYFKSRSAAMKLVDPSIKIFGVDSEDLQSGLHARLFGGSDNIAGKVTGKNYYYCDGLSWHRYPQDNGLDPAVQGLAINELAKTAPAILEGWYLGQQQGNAVANVLFGKVNPSGKLTVTFPRSVGDLPVYYNRKPLVHEHNYISGPFKPLYPFGHGLSYTAFKYDGLTISPTAAKPGELIKVDVKVTNTGKVAGDEIVQLYIRDVIGSVTRPIMELKDFRRTPLVPGETKTVSFTITAEKLHFHDVDMKRVVEPGDFKVMVGTSSAEFLAGTFKIQEP